MIRRQIATNISPKTRLLILRPDNIGDVVLFSGALRHIRNLYPFAHITLAVKPHIVNLVELCPYVDESVSINQLTWWGRLEQTRLPLKHRFEHVICGTNSFWNRMVRPFDIIVFPVKTPPFYHLKLVYLLHGKQVLGVGGSPIVVPKDGDLSRLNPGSLFTGYLDVSQSDAWAHEFSTTRNFLQWMGCRDIPLDDILPQFWLSGSEVNFIADLPREGRRIIGLFPGASAKGRQWSSVNYGELAGMLPPNVIYVLFGSPEEVELGKDVTASITRRCPDATILNLTGKTTLRQLVKTISACDLFIGMETSGLHIAIATGIPSIGIVGGGHYGRFVPWGDPGKNIILTSEMECFHCNWACTNTVMECINGISPAEVAGVANKLLLSI